MQQGKMPQEKLLYTFRESGKILGLKTSVISELTEHRELTVVCGKYIHAKELERFAAGDTAAGKHLLTDYTKYAYESIIKDEQEATTLAGYEYYLLYIYRFPGFENVFIEDINPDDIKEFFKNVQLKNGQTPSISILLKIKFLLNRVFDIALEENIIKRSPMRFLKNFLNGKKSQSERDRAAAIPFETLKAALREVRGNDTYAPIILTLLHTGMRIGEVIALEYGNINFEMGYIRVVKAYKRVPDPAQSSDEYKGRVGGPKTEGSARDIYVHKSLLKMLRKRKQDSGGQKLVFPNKFGEIYSYSGLRNSVSRFWAARGINPRAVHFHLFRHSYGTYMEAAGVKESVCRELMGHRSGGDAHSVYIDVLPEQKREAAMLYYEYMKEIFVA
jgi:integrase